MKKIILIAVISAGLFACKKECPQDPQPERCYECETTKNRYSRVMDQYTNDYCGITEQEAREVEKRYTYMEKVNIPGYASVTVEVTTRCRLK